VRNSKASFRAEVKGQRKEEKNRDCRGPQPGANAESCLTHDLTDT